MSVISRPIIIEDFSYEKDRFIVSVKSAQYKEAYSIDIEFSDGTRKTVDFGPFLSKVRHSLLQRYRNIDTFKAFSVKNGELFWSTEQDEYDMIFPIAELYAGVIPPGL